MSSTDEFDDITADDLREQGSLKWTKYGGDTIGAFVAEMDFGVAPPIAKALHAAVERATFGYLPPALRAGLAASCARWYERRYGWSVDPATVIPITDVLTGFTLVMEHFTRPDSPIILPTPAYMPFRSIPPRHGRRIIEVPMILDGDRYVMDLDGIDRAYRAGGHLLVLCNPHNPTGRVFTADELGGVTEVVDRHGGLVFSDEIHAPLTYPGHRHVPYASTSDTAAAHTVTATSASKAWNLPGLKCGQLIVTAALDGASAAERLGDLVEYGASTLGAIANAAAYHSGRRWLDDVLGYLNGNRLALRDLLGKFLPQIRYTPPEATYLAWLDCRDLGVADPAAFLLDAAGIAVVDGAQCGEAGRGYVRFTFATPRPILEQAVARLAQAVATR